MTTPGGVPNLPVGALTIDTLADKTQDMSVGGMKARVVERFPSIFDGSTGGSPAVDITPTGVITGLYAGTTSGIAQADPNDIQGPEDLPNLFLSFIEDLPVIGQFVELLEAIAGTYDGDADVLNAIQDFFAPVRALLQAVGDTVGSILPTAEEIIAGWTGQVTETQNTANLALALILGQVGGGLGTSGSDPFDGAVSTPSTIPNITQATWGSASNGYYIDGTGKLKFQSGGVLGNYTVCTRTDFMFVGDYQTNGIFIPQHIPSGVQLFLLNRTSFSPYFETYCAIVTDTEIQSCWIESSGGTPVFHNLGTPSSYAASDGEYWEIDVGETDLTNDYMMRVRRNGSPAHQWDDTTMAIAPSSAHRNIAFGAASGGVFVVTPAPTIETQTWYERV